MSISSVRDLAALAALASALTMPAAHAQSAFGWMEMKAAPGGSNIVQITGHALAFERISGAQFTLSVRRLNGGNSSNTRQSGQIDLAPHEAKTLSTTSINVEAGDALTIELKITSGGKEVSSATLSASAPSQGPDAKGSRDTNLKGESGSAG
jgi:hypothetical protein